MIAQSETMRRAGAFARRVGALLGMGVLAISVAACAGGVRDAGGPAGSAAQIRSSGPSQEAEYQRYVEQMTSMGRFRTERAPADARYDARALLRNFELVAFVPEAPLAQYYTGRSENRRVSRWTRPVRYTFIGDGVRSSDRAAFASLAAELSQLTGLSFSEASSEGDANMRIFVLSADARAALYERSGDSPTFRGSVAEAWVRGVNPPCFALFRTSGGEGGEISQAAIFVKDELEDPFRTACFVEETTQSLGLMFDHDEVRPSIFNDDQEFIALTRHDEALLRILYDSRMFPGMSRTAAVALAETIIRENGQAFGVN